ncbi:hypothetical protein [Methylomagnum sp.]
MRGISFSAGLLSLSFALGAGADAPDTTPTTPKPPETAGNVVISSAVDAACFANSIAEALATSQFDWAWWEPLGYGSAAEAISEALSYSVAGISFNMRFNVVANPVGGAVSQLDFQANIDNGSLVLAATNARHSARRFARTWRDDWKYSPRSRGVAWVTDGARTGRAVTRGRSNASQTGGAESGNYASASNYVFVSGTSIDSFHNQLSFNAYSWSSAASNSYAALFVQSASALGWRMGRQFAAAAGKAMAKAIAETATRVEVDLEYKTVEGGVGVQKATVTLACGSGSSATTEAYAEEEDDGE